MDRQPRNECKIRATVRYGDGESRGTIMDLSETGINLYVSFDLGFEVGREIAVDTNDLGLLNGHVRWTDFPRLGVELGRCSNTAAKLASYFRAHA